MMLGFSEAAQLDEGGLWPTALALQQLGEVGCTHQRAGEAGGGLTAARRAACCASTVRGARVQRAAPAGVRTARADWYGWCGAVFGLAARAGRIKLRYRQVRCGTVCLQR